MTDTTPRARIYKPPHKPEIIGRSIFLAGSIEMGAAEDWQTSASDPQFREQVEWELDQLERCDVIAMYLDPNTKAPISLLELGLFAQTSKMVVCCPDGFYRKGNVEIVCERANVPLVQNLNQLIDKVIEKLTENKA
ncbi:hypothetical protein MVEN_01362300 [Mycena venus]|uniref:Nucleoside 2-deoxyribosyltransferase n=1 Tax=Mycena venus TaxID=2733690 RepID=A0A8H6XUM9_9AGAR|nr:hypothetical protein MVEN_01362300 [Mycena venus]